MIRKGFTREAKAPSVPPGCRVYAVGDIHGRLDLLQRLNALIVADAQTAPQRRVLIYLGDYVDRGTNSKGVIDCLLQTPDEFETYFLRGNHDQAVLDFLAYPPSYRSWKSFGAQETLLSYGIRPPLYDNDEALIAARNELSRALPQTHLAFLQGLTMSLQVGGYFFVHAGVRPGISLERQAVQDMMWIRDEFLFSAEDFGKIVVHGHTPSDGPVCRHNRIGIDTGAYATGRLAALVLEGANIKFLHAA